MMIKPEKQECGFDPRIEDHSTQKKSGETNTKKPLLRMKKSICV